MPSSTNSSPSRTGGTGNGGCGGGGGRETTDSSSAAVPTTDILPIPLIHDSLTFEGRQVRWLKELEKQVEADLKRKRRDWQREVERMREELLRLNPERAGSQELAPPGFAAAVGDPLVARRRGSTDVLDGKRMKTLYADHPDDGGRRFLVRFDLTGFEPDTIRVSADNDRLCVRAARVEESPEHSSNWSTTMATATKEYSRKIERPRGIDPTAFKSSLSLDGILTVEASMTLPKTLNLQQQQQQQHQSKTAAAAPPSSVGVACPSYSSLISTSSPAPSPPVTPSHHRCKLGVPTFHGGPGADSHQQQQQHENGNQHFNPPQHHHRRLNLVLDIGTSFQPRDVTVQVIKDNRIIVKARHDEQTSEKLSKSKYTKEFELTERVETFSVRCALAADGRLVVRAFTKGYERPASGQIVTEELGFAGDLKLCNVLDLATFPPTMPASAANVTGEEDGEC